MYSDNDWYGHRTILARYCNVPATRPILGHIQHGWQLRPRPTNRLREFIPLPDFLWSDRALSAYPPRFRHRAIGIGAPFAYLHRLEHRDTPPPLGVGLLAFPPHSSDGDDTFYDADRFIEGVRAISSGSVSVSVFYMDLDKPETALYRQAGWRIVSFGSRGTPRFLLNVLSEIEKHELVVSSHPQSALMYAGLLGRHLRIVDVRQKDFLSDTSTLNDLRREFSTLYERGLSPSEAIDMAHSELGFNHMLDPRDLAKFLGWSTPTRRTLALIGRRINDIRLGERKAVFEGRSG